MADRALPALPAADWTHAAQLGAAVVLAWGASALLHLPEGFWAVMSALIVLRPTAGATLGAGWDRIRGTLAGTALGLGGVALRHLRGIDATLLTLGLVTLLAAASALVPWLRSAPITALIVLGSGGTGAHSALDVASLRTAEIGLGVATGALLSLASLWQATAARFDRACADALREIAAQLRRDVDAAPPDPADRERHLDALRQRLRALAVQAVGAQREARLIAWLRRWRGEGAAPEALDPVRAARVLARTLHDATLVTRQAALRRGDEPEPDHAALAVALADALEDAARGLAAGRPVDEAGLQRHARTALQAAGGAPWVRPTVRLLMQDLATLGRRAGPVRGG